MEPYHTGIELFDYEITLSPRGGIGLESKKIVKARHKHSYESDVTYRDYLLQLALNLSAAFAQHHVTKYVRRP